MVILTTDMREFQYLFFQYLKTIKQLVEKCLFQIPVISILSVTIRIFVIKCKSTTSFNVNFTIMSDS